MPRGFEFCFRRCSTFLSHLEFYTNHAFPCTVCFVESFKLQVFFIILFAGPLLKKCLLSLIYCLGEVTNCLLCSLTHKRIRAFGLVHFTQANRMRPREREEKWQKIITVKACLNTTLYSLTEYFVLFLFCFFECANMCSKC